MSTSPRLNERLAEVLQAWRYLEPVLEHAEAAARGRGPGSAGPVPADLARCAARMDTALWRLEREWMREPPPVETPAEQEAPK